MTNPSDDRLSSIERRIPAIGQTCAELLLFFIARPWNGSNPTAADWRAAGRVMVTLGSELTEFGVRMGVRANDLDREEEPQ
jgi:hypothetical protein